MALISPKSSIPSSSESMDPGSVPKRFVKLLLPSDTPAARTIGYYSDGAKHAALVTVSASGRRLFVEVSADRTLYTNVAEYLTGDLD